MAGHAVKCPGCNTKLQVPAMDNSAQAFGKEKGGAPKREVWKETDPTNPNALVSFGTGMVLTVIWYVIIYFFQAPAGTPSSEFTTGQTLANLFYKHLTVSFVNTLFFFWSAAICYLKLLKLRHQRQAMLLDVLPQSLGNNIDAENVGKFIDHVYGLPVTLRDSLMVNRIRKALEFFEVRQNVADVSSLMSSQSGIDGSRIIGSYIIVKAFLWAIPLLGFIGTVVGLSHAISGMSFSNVEDVSKIVGSINNVTSGLGTAFDATLLGLVFAVVLNFPMNSLLKHEEEALNDIDAFCNEVLLPRLDDGAADKARTGPAETPQGMKDVADALVQALTGSQSEFLEGLNQLSGRMLEYADRLEGRNEQFQQAALEGLQAQLGALGGHASEILGVVQEKSEAALQRFSEQLTGLESSSRELQENLCKSQEAVLNGFAEKVGAVSDTVSQSLAGSLTVTETAVAGLSEHVGKMEASTKQYQESVKTAHEEALKNHLALVQQQNDAALQKFAEQMAGWEKSGREMQEGLQKNQEAAFAGFAERVGAVSDVVSKSLNQSLKVTETAVAGLSEHVSKMEATTKQYQDGVKEAQEGALKSHLALLQQHNEAALQKVVDQVANWEKTSRELSASVLKSQEGVLSSFVEKVGSMRDSVSQSLAHSLQVTESTVAGFAQHVGKLEATTIQYQESVKSAQEAAIRGFAERSAAVSAAVEKSLTASLDLTQKTFGNLEGGVRSLNAVLEQLGAKQVVIQQEKKKGWFSRG